jgi:hypothetical protein
MAEGQIQQRRHRRAARISNADPPEHAEQVGQPQALVTFQARHGADQQRVGDEVHQRKQHRRDQQQAGVGEPEALHPVEERLQQRAGHEHGEGRHRRAGNAAGPALGTAP